MRFTNKMNNWGKAGVIIWWIVVATVILEAALGVFSATTVGTIIALGIAAYVGTKLEEDKITNGTLFCTVLSPVIGLIAHLINGNPSKKNAA